MKEDLRQKAFLELNEKEDDFVHSQVEKLTLLILSLENFRCPTSKTFLIRFLRSGKFDVEESFKMIQKYYGMRRDNSTLFHNLSPSYLKAHLDQGLQIILKGRDKNGRNVFIFRPGTWSLNETNLDQIFLCNYLCFEEMTLEMETQINGIIAVIDFEGFSFQHAKNFTPKHAYRMVQIIQGSFPCRFQEFHVVNQPYIFNLVFSIVKPFLFAKIRNRVKIHGKDLESLEEICEPEILPDFLGGLNKKWEEEWNEFKMRILHKEKYYQEMLQYGFQAENS